MMGLLQHEVTFSGENIRCCWDELHRTFQEHLYFLFQKTLQMEFFAFSVERFWQADSSFGTFSYVKIFAKSS